MVYFGLGLSLLLAGYTLLSGDTGWLPDGSKIPFNFGEHKDTAGVCFVFAGVFLFWMGKKSLRNSDGEN